MQVAIEDAMDAAKIATNPAAISMFLAEHVAERAKRRKEAIAIGVKAAAERERYAEIMRSNVKVTAGISGTVANAGFNDAAIGGLSQRPRVEPGGRLAQRARVEPGRGLGQRGRVRTPNRAAADSGPGNSVVTGGTLGSAAMDVGVGKASRGRTVMVASLGAAAMLGVGGLALLLTRSPAAHVDTTAVVQAPAAASSVAVPTTVATVTTPWTAATVDARAAGGSDADGRRERRDERDDGRGQRAAPGPARDSNGGPTGSPGFGQRPMLHTMPAPRPGHTTKTRVDDGF